MVACNIFVTDLIWQTDILVSEMIARVVRKKGKFMF